MTFAVRAGRLEHARPQTLSSTAAYLDAAAFALASLQSSLDMLVQPCPLQLFMPLQLFFADLHSDIPLQEFTPAQCVLPASASPANDTLGTAEVNSIAAAAAIAALDSLLICMILSSMSF
jgi:hypothetical protein